MLPPALARKFPKLLTDSSAKKTSCSTPQYNCIAWAAEFDQDRWWQPIKEESWDHWPDGVPDDCSFDSFIILFEKMGYKKCGMDSRPEIFYEKVALYYSDEKILPSLTEDVGFTHVARQLASGAWTSKLSADEDIRHGSLDSLEGNNGHEYGKVKQILKRPCGLFGILPRAFYKIKSWTCP